MTQLEMFATPSYPDAEHRRDTGITRAVEHADHEVPDWSEWALAVVRDFAAIRRAPFLTEDVREWAHGLGLDKPPDGRAWGAVMQRARRAGYIRNVGYRSARSSNLSPKVLWATV